MSFARSSVGGFLANSLPIDVIYLSLFILFEIILYSLSVIK